MHGSPSSSHRKAVTRRHADTRTGRHVSLQIRPHMGGSRGARISRSRKAKAPSQRFGGFDQFQSPTRRRTLILCADGGAATLLPKLVLGTAELICGVRTSEIACIKARPASPEDSWIRQSVPRIFTRGLDHNVNDACVRAVRPLRVCRLRQPARDAVH